MIVHIEGRGLAIGIEFELPNGDPATAEVERLHHMALRKKLLLQRGGPAKNLINMIPALNITRAQIDEVVDRFVELLNDLLLEPQVVESVAAAASLTPHPEEHVISK